MAHGFYTLSEVAITVYNVTSVYSAQHDSGIRWDSVGIQWADKTRLSQSVIVDSPLLKILEAPSSSNPSLMDARLPSPIAFVTGGTGFIGHHLVSRLIREKWQVHLVVRRQSDLSMLKGNIHAEFVHVHDGSTLG